MSKENQMLEDRNASLEREKADMQAKFQTENNGLRQMVKKAESERLSAEKQLEEEKEKVMELLELNETIRAQFKEVQNAMDKTSYKI
jgi:hypothetical protein